MLLAHKPRPTIYSLKYTLADKINAEKIVPIFEKLLPTPLCFNAIISCKFSVRSPVAVSVHKRCSGAWIHTRVLTESVKLGESGKLWTPLTGGRMLGKGIDSADVILGLFGLNSWNILTHYGLPEDAVDYSLLKLIQDLKPEFLQ